MFFFVFPYFFFRHFSKKICFYHAILFFIRSTSRGMGKTINVAQFFFGWIKYWRKKSADWLLCMTWEVRLISELLGASECFVFKWSIQEAHPLSCYPNVAKHSFDLEHQIQFEIFSFHVNNKWVTLV